MSKKGLQKAWRATPHAPGGEGRRVLSLSPAAWVGECVLVTCTQHRSEQSRARLSTEDREGPGLKMTADCLGADSLHL